MSKIKVYRKDNGQIVRVPEHYMEHPILRKPFNKTLAQKNREAAAEAASPKTPSERAGTAATPTPTRESAIAGDDKKE